MRATGGGATRQGFDCVIFDLDGTLLDTRDAMLAALDDMLASLHRPPADRAALETAIHYGLSTMLRVAVDDGRQLPRGRNLARLERGLRAHYLRKARQRVRIYPGAHDLLERLRRRGVWLGLCSNQAEISVQRLLQQTGLAPYFARVVGGDSLPRHKPDPLPLHWLVTQAGSRAAATLMVGDSAVDAACAEAAGCAVALMRHGRPSSGIAPGTPHFADFAALAAHLAIDDP